VCQTKAVNGRLLGGTDAIMAAITTIHINELGSPETVENRVVAVGYWMTLFEE
jgi:uncharacterized membrane protein